MPSERSWAGSSWSARVTLGASREVTAYKYHDVWLIEVSGEPLAVADDVDLAVQLALAENPRGVACSVSGDERATGADLELWDRLGRHVHSWPPTPVVVVCPDDATWAAAAHRPEARFLQRSSSLLHAWSQITSLPRPRTSSVRLQPGAHAARDSRRFLSRTCSGWDVAEHLSAGPLVVSELVTNAVEHGRGEVDVHLAEYHGDLRIAVRDREERPPVTRNEDPDSLDGRGLRIVQSLARASGALPAAGGGKLVWAVLGREAALSASR